MVVVQVRSQMVSNYDVPGHGCFEKIFLHVARRSRFRVAITERLRLLISSIPAVSIFF